MVVTDSSLCWALRFHCWVAVLVVKVIHARAYHAGIAADMSWKFTSDLSLSSMLADGCRLICMLQFKRIEEIEGMPANTLLDVLGILESVGDFATLTLKNATEQTKRSVVLRDNSNRSIELTLWGSFASDPGDQLAQVRALLAGNAFCERVTDWDTFDDMRLALRTVVSRTLSCWRYTRQLNYH